MNSSRWLALLGIVLALLAAGTACSASGEAVSAANGEDVSTTGDQAAALNQEELEAMLIETEKTKWGLNGEENFLTMADTYADDFINIGWFPTGAMRLNKEEAFAMVPPPAEGPAPVLSDFLVVHPDAASAIVTYKVAAPWATIYATSVYAERDSAWQTVFYQATDAAAPAPEAMGEAAMPQQDIQVIFSGGTCTIEGPRTLSAGDIGVTLQAQDLDKEGYSAAFLTLDAEKTPQDLIQASAQPNAEKPAWVNEIMMQWVGPGESKSYTMPVTSGPVYLVCFSWNEDRYMIGYEGPIAVGG